jgi:hypothetical protein
MLRESLLMNTVDLALATERTLLLLGCYRRSDVGDPEIFTRAVIAVFMRYPESVVVPVTEPATGLPAKLKWLPSIAEIREACERAMEPILRQRERERIEDDGAGLCLRHRGTRVRPWLNSMSDTRSCAWAGRPRCPDGKLSDRSARLLPRLALVPHRLMLRNKAKVIYGDSGVTVDAAR